MPSNEPALRAVLTQAQFELAQTAAEVAQAAALSGRAQQQVSVVTERCESAASELRGVALRSLINPALLQTMHRLYRAEKSALHEWQTRLAAAQEREELARAELAAVRNRERSLERALRAERRKQQQKRQALDLIQADDMWLQRVWREAS
jgi:hypothetical protein